jgi:hypothetical protein
MPERVYRTLVAQANASLPTLHRYLRLRRRLLGIQDELGYHDNYPSRAGVDLAQPSPYRAGRAQGDQRARLQFGTLRVGPRCSGRST